MEEQNVSISRKIAECEGELKGLDKQFVESVKSLSAEKDPVRKREMMAYAAAKLSEYMAKLNEMDRLRDERIKGHDIIRHMDSRSFDELEKEISNVSAVVRDDGSEMVNPIIIELKNDIKQRNELKAALNDMMCRLKNGHDEQRCEEMFLSCVDTKNRIDKLTGKINVSEIGDIVQARKLNENTVAQVHDKISVEQMTDLMAAARKYKESLPKEQRAKLRENKMRSQHEK